MYVCMYVYACKYIYIGICICVYIQLKKLCNFNAEQFTRENCFAYWKCEVIKLL